MIRFICEWTGWALIELGDFLDSAVLTPPLCSAGQMFYRLGDGGVNG